MCTPKFTLIFSYVTSALKLYVFAYTNDSITLYAGDNIGFAVSSCHEALY